MYIINTTYAIENTLSREWKEWVSQTLFPAILHTGEYTSPRMFKVLTDNADSEDFSFCIQFETEIAGVRLWKNTLEQQVRKLVFDRFGQKALGFSTILKLME